MRVAHPAIEGVERVGNQHYFEIRVILAGADQRASQLGRQGPVAVLPGKLVEQEHVQDHQPAGLADDLQHLIEDLLSAQTLPRCRLPGLVGEPLQDRKSTRLNSSHVKISYAVFCLKKQSKNTNLKT